METTNKAFILNTVFNCYLKYLPFILMHIFSQSNFQDKYAIEISVVGNNTAKLVCLVWLIDWLNENHKKTLSAKSDE